MPTEKEVLTGFLSKTLNMDEAGVTSLYKEDGSELKDEALQLLIDRDAERITGLKPDTKKIQDDWYKKGQSESLSNYEKRIAQAFNFKTDKKGDEFLAELQKFIATESPDDPEKIRKSRIFIDELEKKNTELSEVEGRYKEQLDAYKKQVENEKLFAIVIDDALIQLENLKPILPQDAAKAANLKKIFINEMASVNYEIREGKKILLNKDGTDKLDSHGNRVTFEGFIKENAEKYFEFYKADPKSAAPAPGGGSPKPTVFNITSEADYVAQRATCKPEDRPALFEAYNAFCLKQQGN